MAIAARRMMRRQGIAGTVPGGELMGWQVTASNIGLAGLGIDGNSLPLYNGSNVVPAGTVIEGRRITSSLELYQGSITIRRCLIRPTSAGQGMPLITTSNYNVEPVGVTPATVTIEDCEIDGTELSDFSAAWCTGFMGVANLYRNYIHHFGSGVGFMPTGMQLDAVVENNYITDLVSWGNGATNGNHCDGFTIRDFSNAARPTRSMMVRNNRFDCNTENASGACFLQAYSGTINNVTIQGNLLEGNSYNLVLENLNSSYSNMRCINNRFNVQGYGPHYYYGPGWTQWSENYRNNPANPENKGASVGM